MGRESRRLSEDERAGIAWDLLVQDWNDARFHAHAGGTRYHRREVKVTFWVPLERTDLLQRIRNFVQEMDREGAVSPATAQQPFHGPPELL